MSSKYNHPQEWLLFKLWVQVDYSSVFKKTQTNPEGITAVSRGSTPQGLLTGTNMSGKAVLKNLLSLRTWTALNPSYHRHERSFSEKIQTEIKSGRPVNAVKYSQPFPLFYRKIFCKFLGWVFRDGMRTFPCITCFRVIILMVHERLATKEKFLWQNYFLPFFFLVLFVVSGFCFPSSCLVHTNIHDTMWQTSKFLKNSLSRHTHKSLIPKSQIISLSYLPQ